MIERDYLIVGAGLGGASVCEGIREHDKKGSVMLVGSEPFVPYHRARLSRDFQKGAKLNPADAFHLEPDWYVKNHIDLRLGTTVMAFNLERRVAVLADGQAVSFRKACLATGSRAIVPQVAGARLGNVFYLRTMRDAQALHEVAGGQKDAVVVGGGVVALEAAASLRQRGLKVTLLDRHAALWQPWLDAETAQWLTEHVEAKGVNLMLREDLKGFEGKTVLKNVATKSGERLTAGLALVAAGVEQNLELIRGTPLHSPGGTPVGEHLETDEKGIFAVGGIALFPDKLYGGVRCVEHGDSVLEQGRLAGANMSGKKRQKFHYVPCFSSEVFDLRFQFYGDFRRPPSLASVEGSRAKKKFTARYSEGGKLRGVVLCNPVEGAGEAAREEIRAACATG